MYPFLVRRFCWTAKTQGSMPGYRDISDRKRVEALSSALYRVAEKSSSAHDLQQFFAAVHSIVDELMYGRNFYIALYDSGTELLSFPYFVDERDTAPPPKKLGRGLTDYLIRTGEPLLATPEVLQAMEDRGEVARNGSKSLDWMGVPLKVNNHTFGALVVQTYSQNIRYGDRDKEILTLWRASWPARLRSSATSRRCGAPKPATVRWCKARSTEFTGPAWRDDSST